MSFISLGITRREEIKKRKRRKREIKEKEKREKRKERKKKKKRKKEIILRKLVYMFTVKLTCMLSIIISCSVCCSFPF